MKTFIDRARSFPTRSSTKGVGEPAKPAEGQFPEALLGVPEAGRNHVHAQAPRLRPVREL